LQATCQQPCPTALPSGVPIDVPGASMSAPPSMSASATSTSSLRTAQCSGVRVFPERPILADAA
jgi:hypothetical protein